MRDKRPDISVIIPTHNRKLSLRRTLEALKMQTYPLSLIEVIVVVDGDTDGTLKMLKNYTAPFTLHVLDQSNAGQGVARNCGASSAVAPLLLFLDDDVEPSPSLIEAHVRAHQRNKGHAIIGPYLPVHQDNSFFQIHMRFWWEKVFHTMLQHGHRFAFSDLLTGNMSIETELFTRFGGFNPSLKVHEDYEFGMRLIKADVPFLALSDAIGHHHDMSDVQRSFQRKCDEGKADVIMARLHPEFSRALPLAQPSGSRASLKRIMRILSFYWPGAGNAFAEILRHVLAALEKTRLRQRWRQLYGVLQSYWYWRGVAEVVSRKKLREVLGRRANRAGQTVPEVEIDLIRGLERAEERLDRERPAAIRICLGPRLIGVVPFLPGAENLRGVHLRTILAKSLAVPFLQVLALEGNISESKTVNRIRLSQAIKERSHWFGPIRPGQMWYEQYSQWNGLKKENSERQWAENDYGSKLAVLEHEIACLEKQRLYWEKLTQKNEQITVESCVVRSNS